jgi:hypothetical protein
MDMEKQKVTYKNECVDVCACVHVCAEGIKTNDSEYVRDSGGPRTVQRKRGSDEQL